MASNNRRRSRSVLKKAENAIPEWSKLAKDLIYEISTRFDTRIDLLRFRSVCKSWQSYSLPLPPKSLFLKVPIPQVDSMRRELYQEKNDHYVLTESLIYSVQPLLDPSTLPTGPITRSQAKIIKESTKPCIIKVEEQPSGNARLVFPLSSVYLRFLEKQMPGIARLYGNGFDSANHKLPPQEFNYYNHRVVELGKAYGLKSVKCFENTPPVDEEDYLYSLAEKIFVHKVVISSKLPRVEVGFSVLIVDELGLLFGWKVGDEAWTEVIYRGERTAWNFVDIIFHDGKFYAIDQNGMAITIDPKTFETAGFAPEVIPRNSTFIQYDNEDYSSQMFLVESLGELFLIENLVDCFENLEKAYELDKKSARVDVLTYKLDKNNREWVKVDRLEDRVFFLGDNTCFSISTSDFETNKGCCLYFKLRFECIIDDEMLCHIELEDGDLKNGIIKLFHPNDDYFKLLYPPPAWLIKED